MKHISTEDQNPNLSDCHGCRVRINHTNPRHRLQPMNSLWRIVLLCKKCTKRVNSSELCPYCFTVVNETDCFICRDCKRSIHKDCVKQYDLKLGFYVCVDCWIPEAFSSSSRSSSLIRARKRRFGIRNPKETNLSVEEVERKVAARASENALMKAVVAKNAVELAKGILSVVRCRKVAGGVDDAELAVLLHRAINSSPRIASYAWFGRSVGRDDESVTCYSRRRVGKGNSTLGVRVPLVCYSRRRAKVCVKNSGSLNAPLLCYSRRRSSRKACLRNSCQENDVGRIGMKPDRYLLKYCRVGKGKPRPSLFVKESANLYTEGITDTRSFGNGYECHEICEKLDGNTDRFLLKYKRISRSKPSNHPMESTALSDASPCSSSQGEL